MPDASTPRRGRSGQSQDRRYPTAPTLLSWPGSPICSRPGGRTPSSSSPRRTTPSTPGWSRPCWSCSRCGRPSSRSPTGAGGRRASAPTTWSSGMLRTTTLTPMAHLICVAHTRLELAEILVEFRKAGVENLMALGGDPPTDPDAAEGELRHAIELVELARAIGGFSIGVAAHPAGHPRSPDMTIRPRLPGREAAAGGLRGDPVLLPGGRLPRAGRRPGRPGHLRRRSCRGSCR